MLVALDDSSLVEEFTSGADPHVETAKMVLDLDGELTDEERQKGKRLNYAILFLGGRRTICKQLKVDWAEAGRLLDKLHEGRPGIKRLVDQLEIMVYARGYGVPLEEAEEVKWKHRSWKKREAWRGLLDGAIERGAYVTTVAGRHIHVPEARHAIMAIIQGSAAEIMKSAMLAQAKDLKEKTSHLVLSVHDELGWDAIEEEKDWLIEQIPGWMDYPKVSEVVPLPVDIAVSYKSWADKVGV